MAEIRNRTVDADSVDILPLTALRDHGLLWLINAAVFHPRGFALALDIDSEGAVIGWTMIGDGQEVLVYLDEDARREFVRAEAFLDSLRPGAGS